MFATLWEPCWGSRISAFIRKGEGMMHQLIEKLQSERRDLLDVIAWYRGRERAEGGAQGDYSGVLTDHMLRLGELEAEIIVLRKGLSSQASGAVSVSA